MNQEKIDIVITSNSPGEIYSFVRPCVKSIKALLPSARIILVIMPCQYASGREIEVARSFEEVYEIIFPEEFRAWMFKNKPPKGITFAQKGVLLYLGGDLLQAGLLAKKLGYRAAAYINDRFGWNRFFCKFFVADDRMASKAVKKRIPRGKVRVVGDLMAEEQKETASKEKWGLDPGKPVVAFMPGSRSAHAKFMAPFFVRTAELMKEKCDAQFVLGLSPYINVASLEKYLKTVPDGMIKEDLGSSARLSGENGQNYLISQAGARLLVMDRAPYEAIGVSDLILTIPGTNTAEAASMGKPMLVLLPLNKPEVLIFDGLVGIAGELPLIGGGIKKLTAYVLNRLIKYTALPNIKAGSFVVPELRGKLTPARTAETALELLHDKELLERTSKTLKAVMGSPGASGRIAEEISHLLNVSGGPDLL